MAKNTQPLQWGLTVGGCTLVLVGISLFFAFGPWETSEHANVVWPERLSVSVSGALVVNLTEDDTLAPVPGAKVTLYQLLRSPSSPVRIGTAVHGATADQLRVLSEATTDTLGTAALTLAPVAMLQGTETIPGQQIGCLQEQGRGCTIDLVVQVQSGSGTLYLHRTYGAPEQATLALTTDRPLYQP
ncbi:MAG: hypothetical protein AAFS10_21630, partial [Myxococcota bacterium]